MLAATGVIIPVIIHFWNRKEGKTLKVGSISLLTQSYKQQAKSLHLQELLLLLLRCSLIILIAFLLSNPVWQEQPDARNQKGWVLMEKNGLQQTYSQFKPVIDSLIKKEYEFHYFNTGFEKFTLETALKKEGDTVTQNTSYWSLLSSLNKQVPTALPIYLFTINSLQKFSGDRSEVAMNLNWFTYTSKDSVSKWLAKAYITTADSIRLVAATSQPSGTMYSYKNVPVTSQKTADYNINTGNNNLTASLQDNNLVTIDTTSLKITIYTDKYNNDAAYLKAALEAIQQYSKRKIKISTVSNSANISNQQDWLLWLSDLPVSSAHAKNILTYEKGKTETTGSTIQSDNIGADEERPALYKRVSYQPTITASSDAIWQDGFGNPVLIREKGKATIYHFYSRFDPSWNDLPWSNAFPQMIFNLINNNQNIISGHDNRIMDEHQLLPIFTAANKAVVKDKIINTYDLSQFFWLAAFIVFVVERFLSFRTKMEKLNV